MSEEPAEVKADEKEEPNKKVLFLAIDKEHALPVRRSVDILREKHGIDLTIVQTTSAEEAMRRASDPVDCILIHQQLVGDGVFECGKPVVILERIDGAQLESRHWVAQAAGIIKGYVFQPRELHNRYKGRAMAHLLRESGVAVENSCAWPGFPQPQLSSAELTKLHTGYGFGAYRKMDRPRGQLIDFGAPREYDCSFFGVVDYNNTEIEWHRKAALAAVEQLSPKRNVSCGGGRPLRPDKYLGTMFRSKSVVSPWGWGEAAHRDYEAMLLGAVLIKPDMSHVAAWPNIYESDVTYLPCRLDFADLPEIVGRVAEDWESFRGIRENARQLAIAAGDPSRIARRLADILEACGC